MSKREVRVFRECQHEMALANADLGFICFLVPNPMTEEEKISKLIDNCIANIKAMKRG
jgi:hypothetical protein